VPSGGLFGHVRDYSNQPRIGAYNGPNGYNWLVRQLPAASAAGGGSKLHITFDSNRDYVFHATGGAFQSHYKFLNTTLEENTTTQKFTFVKTSKGRTETTVFNSLAAASNPGQFVSHTDARGVTTTVASRAGSQINELQRSYVIGGVTTTESLLYTYFTTGYLQSVTYRLQVGGGSWTPVKQVTYAYYGASDANGSVNDLQSASKQLPNGTGGWNTVAMDYYRYWLAGSSTGFAHGLKMHLGPEAYRLVLNAGLNPATAADADLLPYVDHYFEYNPTTWAVTQEISAVCPSCPGGGTTSDLFSYAANPRYPVGDYNVWNTKTVQTLPDNSQVVVYANYIAQPMLKVTIDSAGTNKWATFYRYNSNGQPICEAEPSAVALPASLSTLEAYDDLLNYNPGTGLYQYLNNSVGLINVTSYDSSGNVLNRAVRQGQAGTNVQVQAFTYTSHSDSSGNTISPIATSVSYPIACSTSTSITTSYAYTWYSGTNQMATRTTTLPLISTAQNGPGTSATVIEQFDTYGNLTQRTDERGIVSNYTYNVVTSLVTEQVLNYQSGVTAPGVNVTTDFTYDNQGRLTQTLGPSHTVVISGTPTTVRSATSVTYIQSAQPGSGTWGVDQTITSIGYATGTAPSYTITPVDPAMLVQTDKDGRTTDQIQTLNSNLSQSGWQTWTSTQYDNQHRTISSRVYFLIPSSGTGTVVTHFGETDYGYDALERRNRVVAPGGTITRTVWTSPQRVANIWVGTNDTDATDADPTGGSSGIGAGNNMVMVTANIYDNGTTTNPGGSGGDGNLVQQIQYVSATAGDTRITGYGYDFRDRRISMTDAIVRYTAYTLDNLGPPD
jgi:YD repeat-containing protein